MLLWILIIAGSVILDQATKMIVVNTMEYGQSIGDIYDVVVENMQRQQEGLKG